MPGISLPDLPVPTFLPILFSPGSSDDTLKDDPQATDLSGQQKRRLRVLVIDDAPDVLEMFGMMLKLSGYDVGVAASPAEALEKATSAQFDLIVSDIGMPEMTGYELAERLRMIPGYESIPMIAVTGFSHFYDRGHSSKAGFDAHLTKPVNPTTLLNLIEQLTE